MAEVERYESLRNGKIGTVVSKTDTEVILDIEGNQRAIKLDNLKRWYKYCGIVEEADVEAENKQADKIVQLNKRVEKADAPNGDNPPKQDCQPLANKIISYLEKNGCVTKKVSSYVRVRLGDKSVKRNIMEVWWGKKVSNLKIVVRSEALISNKELYELGHTVPPTWMYTLDHIYRFDAGADVATIFKIIDTAIAFEKAYVPKPVGKTKGAKNGTGKINGKTSLASKRKVLGIKSDDEIAKEQEELKENEPQVVAVE